MGVRTGAIAILFALAAACAGCGLDFRPAAVNTPSPTDHLPSAAGSASSPAPFADPSPELRTRSLAFVNASLAYDSLTEEPTAFLDRVGSFVTADELGRLQNSERAKLDWLALRQRRERATLKVTGVSVDNSSAVPTLIVDAVRTTTTSFAKVRDLVEITLGFQRSEDSWLISSASGGGL